MLWSESYVLKVNDVQCLSVLGKLQYTVLI